MKAEHGTTRYRQGCHCTECRAAIAAAMADYRKRSYLARGSTLVDSRGVRRRVEALIALGWSTHRIDRLLARRPSYTSSLLRKAAVQLDTHREIAALYERLSMTLPPSSERREKQAASRARNLARQRGYAPPLAWDDIDRDEHPHRPRFASDPRSAHEYDEAVVLRLLSRDFTIDATAAERRAVVARWPGSLGELARLSGWKVERYTTRDGAAA